MFLASLDILRRAWGIYHAIWALSILFFTYIPLFLILIKSVVLYDLTSLFHMELL